MTAPPGTMRLPHAGVVVLERTSRPSMRATTRSASGRSARTTTPPADRVHAEDAVRVVVAAAGQPLEQLVRRAVGDGRRGAVGGRAGGTGRRAGRLERGARRCGDGAVDRGCLRRPGLRRGRGRSRRSVRRRSAARREVGRRGAERSGDRRRSVVRRLLERAERRVGSRCRRGRDGLLRHRRRLLRGRGGLLHDGCGCGRRLGLVRTGRLPRRALAGRLRRRRRGDRRRGIGGRRDHRCGRLRRRRRVGGRRHGLLARGALPGRDGSGRLAHGVASRSMLPTGMGSQAGRLRAS